MDKSVVELCNVVKKRKEKFIRFSVCSETYIARPIIATVLMEVPFAGIRIVYQADNYPETLSEVREIRMDSIVKARTIFKSAGPRLIIYSETFDTYYLACGDNSLHLIMKSGPTTFKGIFFCLHFPEFMDGVEFDVPLGERIERGTIHEEIMKLPELVAYMRQLEGVGGE